MKESNAEDLLRRARVILVGVDVCAGSSHLCYKCKTSVADFLRETASRSGEAAEPAPSKPNPKKTPRSR